MGNCVLFYLIKILKEVLGIMAEVKIPSLGLWYPKDLGIPGSFEIRAMTTADEKIMYGGFTRDTLVNVLKNCIVKPKDIDLDNLYMEDLQALLLNLRIITFGGIYEVSVTCPTCNRANKFRIDLNTLPVKYAESDEGLECEISLPVSKAKVVLKKLSRRDYKQIDNNVKRAVKRNPELNEDELSYVYKIAQYIKSINGKEFTAGEINLKYQACESMHSRDSQLLLAETAKVDIGVDTEIFEMCSSCGNDIDFMLPMGAGFFRPSTAELRGR